MLYPKALLGEAKQNDLCDLLRWQRTVYVQALDA